MTSIFIRFAATLRGGFSIWWLAPAIPLIVVLPEFVQHIVEIELGMFADKETFSDLALEPQRLILGFVKVAGLLLSILAAARFWANYSTEKRWWNLKGILWGRLALSFALAMLVGVPGLVLAESISVTARQIIDGLLTLATLPLIAWLVSALLGDRDMGWKRVWRAGWLPALRIGVFIAVTWVPLQWLHGKTHEWALGAPQAQVWALMGFDALVVGMLAMFAGSALYHGYGAETLSAQPSGEME